MRSVRTIAILAVFAFVTHLRATTYFVSQTNSADSNPGTEAQPWKTIAFAAKTIKPGDTVLVKAGTYHESIAPQCSKVSFRVFGDDNVIISPPESLVDSNVWKAVSGRSNVFEAKLDTKGKILRVDNRVVEFELIRGVKTRVSPEDGTVHRADVDRQFEDTDVYRWTTIEDGVVRINLAGENPAVHKVTLRQAGFTGIGFGENSGCVVQGFDVRDCNYGIALTGNGNRVEDCVVRGADIGAVFGGSQNVLLRSALLRCWQGINIGDGVGNHVIDETFVLGTGQPVLANRSPQADLNNPWGPRCSVRYGNASFNVFRYGVIADGVWAGWWPDVNCYGNYFYGNLVTRVTDRGVYNEYPANDSRILYNAITDCDDGITSRFCWRTMWMYNYLANNRHSELQMWGPHVDVPYYFDNVIAHNLISGSGLFWSLQDHEGLAAGLPAGWPGNGKVSPSALLRMRSNLSADNIFKGKPRDGFADVCGVKFATLEDFQKATQFERGSRIDDNASMEDLGLGLYTVRIPETSRTNEPSALIGNPIRQGVHVDPLPMEAEDNAYFWQQGDANVSRGDSWPLSAFSYTYEWPNFEHPVRRLIRFDRDADPNKKSDEPQTWLECFPHEEARVRANWPKDGSGFWSPSMPTVAGAKIEISLKMRGEKLKGTNGDVAPVVFVQFQSLTGKHVLKTNVAVPGEADFSWKDVKQEVIAPEFAERFAVFLGMKPGEGKVSFADIHVDTVGSQKAKAEERRERYKILDLARYANHELDNDMGAVKGAPAAEAFVRDYCSLPVIDLSKVKAGKFKSGRVPFEVKKAISLRCSRRPPAVLPAVMNGIKVSQKADSIYFLAAGPFQMGAQEYWRCVVHYADGKSVEVLPLSNLADLFYRDSYFLPGGKVEGAEHFGADVKNVGKVFRWRNPRTDEVIDSIDLRSMDAGQVVLLGMTLGKS